MTNSKAEQLRQEARELEQAKEESFERCDTDGFLSQWAFGISAQERRQQAAIEENGGVWDFTVLTWADSGEMVEARIIPTKFGHSWIVSDAVAEQIGRKFVPIDDSHVDPADWDDWRGKQGRSRVQERLGLVQSTREMKAKAKVFGSGTGLAGAASCYVGVVCIDDQYWGWQD